MINGNGHPLRTVIPIKPAECPEPMASESMPVLLGAIKVIVEKLSRDFEKHETECEKRSDVLTEVVRRLDRLEQTGGGTIADVANAKHEIKSLQTRLSTMDVTDAKRVGLAEGSVKTFAALMTILGVAVTATYGAIELIHTLAGGH